MMQRPATGFLDWVDLVCVAIVLRSSGTLAVRLGLLLASSIQAVVWHVEAGARKKSNLRGAARLTPPFKFR